MAGIDEAKRVSNGLGLFVRSLVGLDRAAARRAFRVIPIEKDIRCKSDQVRRACDRSSLPERMVNHARSQPALPTLCSRMRRILALTHSETASEPARFSYRTDPCCGHVAISHAFETSQSSAKDAVTAGIAHSNPITTHRIHHATGFLQTTLSKLPRQSAQQLQLRARGSPDRGTNVSQDRSADAPVPPRFSTSTRSKRGR